MAWSKRYARAAAKHGFMKGDPQNKVPYWIVSWMRTGKDNTTGHGVRGSQGFDNEADADAHFSKLKADAEVSEVHKQQHTR